MRFRACTALSIAICGRRFDIFDIKINPRSANLHRICICTRSAHRAQKSIGKFVLTRSWICITTVPNNWCIMVLAFESRRCCGSCERKWTIIMTTFADADEGAGARTPRVWVGVERSHDIIIKRGSAAGVCRCG